MKRIVLQNLPSIGLLIIGLILVAILLLPATSFLVVGISPKIFDQGSSWFTFNKFAQALGGNAAVGLADSFWVSALAAIVAVSIALAMSWLFQRSDLGGQGIYTILIWAILLSPSYLVADGWQRLLARNSILTVIGLDPSFLRHLLLGPFGVTMVLAFKGFPFAYLAIAVAVAGLGREFEDAARVHGASRLQVVRIVVPILLPALFSGLVIVFAESLSDFGVAATLASDAHFPIATYTLYEAISSFPVNFGMAAAVGWLLMGGVVLALFSQARALKGKSFAVLSGRTRPSVPVKLSFPTRIAALSFLVVFFGLALGVPVLGAFTASLLPNFGSNLSWSNITFNSYKELLHATKLFDPIIFSAEMALVTATIGVVVGAVVGHLLASRRSGILGKGLDLLLLTAVALPGIVLGAGYIFAYNLPFMNNLGINLYGTVALLEMAYLAGALPSIARVLVGPFAQIQNSLLLAARVHGAGSFRSWRKGVLPIIARSLLWSWLLTFSTVFFELPISELLSPANKTPLSIAIITELNKSSYAQGTAMAVIAILIVLLLIVTVLTFFKIITPKGWTKIQGQLM